MQINFIHKENNETFSDEPIMVTIALEEYRSLVEENTRLLFENMNIQNDISKLWAENDELKRQWETERNKLMG